MADLIGRLAAAATMLAIAFTAPPAAGRGSLGAVSCAKRTKLMQCLPKPVARGLSENGALLEVFAQADGDTWTAAAITPGRFSACDHSWH